MGIFREMYEEWRENRALAKEEAREKAEEEERKAKEEASKPPYHHVPTHAAIDMLGAVPAAALEEEFRDAILMHNRINALKTKFERNRHGIAGVKDRYSIYGEPVFPLPVGYTPYDPGLSVEPVLGPGVFDELREQFDRLYPISEYVPEKTEDVKEEELEHIPPTASITLALTSFRGKISTTLSKWASSDKKSGKSSAPNNGLKRSKNVTKNNSHTSSDQPSLSQPSYAPTEKSSKITSTTSQVGVGGPAESDQRYPPQTKSASFPASDPESQQAGNEVSTAENKDISGIDPATQIVSTGSGVVNKLTPPASVAGESPPEAPISSIGPAIAPPRPPCIMAPPPAHCTGEEVTGLEHEKKKQDKASAGTTAEKSPKGKMKPARKISFKIGERGSSEDKPKWCARRNQSNSHSSGAAPVTSSDVDRTSHTAEPKTSEAGEKMSDSDPKIKGKKKKKKKKSRRKSDGEQNRKRWWEFWR
ncbi:hypothetical protein F4811DRAFT_553156 [Daldinia bambusicola]|nr:hypothetical protein F4811DRAFT_553156 [Daldinia bambusicola]